MKQPKRLGWKYEPSEFRKERVRVTYNSTGDLLRAGVLRKIDSPLLHTITEDEPEDLVPRATSRVFDPVGMLNDLKAEKEK